MYLPSRFICSELRLGGGCSLSEGVCVFVFVCGCARARVCVRMRMRAGVLCGLWNVEPPEQVFFSRDGWAVEHHVHYRSIALFA